MQPPPVPPANVEPSTQAGARRWQTISTRNTHSVKPKQSRAGRVLRGVSRLAFPNCIAELRSKTSPVLTQRELSVTLGISDRQLRRIERGKVLPDAKLLGRIAKALAVAVADLYLRRRDGRM